MAMARSQESGSAPRGLRSDQVSGIFLALLGLFIAWDGRVYPLGTLAEPGPGYMPLLVAVFLVVTGSLIAAFGGKSGRVSAMPWPEARRAVLILIISAAGVFALEHIGYRLTMTALLIFFLGVVERRNPFAVAAVAVGFSVVSYYVFATLLLVQLPHSPWGF